MYISKRNATYIVQEISKIIGEKINMMNEEGINHFPFLVPIT